MTKKVTDAELAQYHRFMADIDQRILKGSLDPNAVMDAVRPLIGQNPNPYLRSVSGGHTVSISACKGGKTANLAHAQETFTGLVEPDFKNWGYDRPQPATRETDVDVYEMHNKHADFKTLFGSLCPDLVEKYSYDGLEDAGSGEVVSSLKKNNRVFQSQEQIEKFAREHKGWLAEDARANFFLFTEEVDGEEKVFVADVFRRSDGVLLVIVFRFSCGFVWCAGNAPRVVAPATKNSGS